MKELRPQPLIFGKRDHAIAYVAGRQDLKFFAQAARTAAVVGDGDDCREGFYPCRFRCGSNYTVFTNVRFQSESRLDKPVPPPIDTMRNPRFSSLTFSPSTM